MSLDAELHVVHVDELQPPGASCTIDAQGPATPRKGDVVSGTLHCDNLGGSHLHLNGGPNTPVYETVDGSFQVTI